MGSLALIQRTEKGRFMKKSLMLVSMLGLLAGCAGSDKGYAPNNSGMTTDAGYGSIPAPTQQGSGAYAMSSQPQPGPGDATVVPYQGAAGGYAVPTYGQGAGAGAGATTASPITAADLNFIQTAAQDGLGEIRMGQLMVQDGQSAAMRNYGQQLVTDHTRINQQLAQVAGQKGVTIPTQPGPEQQQMSLQLSNLSGTDFDQMAARDAVQAHQKSIREFQDASNNLQDPDLKGFAQQTLPILQQHLAEAQQLVRNSTIGAQGGIGQ
jgi:predicted outer membrane protein